MICDFRWNQYVKVSIDIAGSGASLRNVDLCRPRHKISWIRVDVPPSRNGKEQGARFECYPSIGDEAKDGIDKASDNRPPMHESHLTDFNCSLKATSCWQKDY